MLFHFTFFVYFSIISFLWASKIIFLYNSTSTNYFFVYKIGKQLGAGAFGVVVEAIAYKINPFEDKTRVAVKMVKSNADNEV